MTIPEHQNDNRVSIDIAMLAEASAEVAATRARLKKIALLSECLGGVSSDELPIAVKFLSGELTQGRIGLGAAAVRRSFQAVSASDSETQPESVSLAEVDSVFSEIAAVKGKGSTARRDELMQMLLKRVSASPRQFLLRLVLGELRQGAQESIMIEAVANKTEVRAADIRRAVMLTGDLADIASAANADGADGLHDISIALFRPVQPMLAEPAEDIERAVETLGTAALEYKLDGVRVQVHKHGDTVRVFTRHLKEVTRNVPELVSRVQMLSPSKVILDGEVSALRADGRPYPFQTTMKRFGRTGGIDELQTTLPLTAMFFDCLLLDEQSLIDEPTKERHLALVDCLPSELIIPRLVTDSALQATDFLNAALAAGHEGVMAKSLEAAYTVGGRGKKWLKIKPVHTLDLVILAAEWGSGRREGWLSNLHLGARDPASGRFVMLGKTFKGLTDEMLAWQTRKLLALQTARDDHTVYVEPTLVAEIAFNEVQQSSQYDSGYALRFARIRRHREDKLPAEADTIDAIARIFAKHRE